MGMSHEQSQIWKRNCSIWQGMETAVYPSAFTVSSSVPSTTSPDLTFGFDSKCEDAKINVTEMKYPVEELLEITYSKLTNTKLLCVGHWWLIRPQ